MRLPLNQTPPEGDLPLPVYQVALAVTKTKSLSEARAGIEALVRLNRIVQNHYRKEALSAPKKAPKRPTPRVNKGGSEGRDRPSGCDPA